MSSITFYGAAGTVTGSRFLLEHEGFRVLVDCGLFQGRKELRLRNWDRWPFDPKSLDAVVLTHAHIDHTGGLPRLVRDGYRGPVYCTGGTRDLSGIMLPDSARIQEEEAKYANKRGYSKHSPALPLYEEADAFAALKLFETFGFDRPRKLGGGVTLTFRRAGHILGSAICVFDLAATHQRVVFSGDLGRYNAPILRDPEAVDTATTLIAESTYGDREHSEDDPLGVLADAVNDTVKRGGVLVIPAFAIGRTQDLLYRLGQLEREKRIPVVPVFVDSPMACDATPLYLAHSHEHDFEMRAILDSGDAPLRTAQTRFVTSARESKTINGFRGPGVIISASGMATGGRILHHLKHRLPDAKNTVLFVGYQGEGTRGRRLVDGEKTLKLLGEVVEVHAKVLTVSGFSAHADWKEMLRWMDGFSPAPRQTLLVHGEDVALEALRQRVAARGWPVAVPKHLETVELVKP
jgi:metallo-beta-lactamase family protein